MAVEYYYFALTVYMNGHETRCDDIRHEMRPCTKAQLLEMDPGMYTFIEASDIPYADFLALDLRAGKVPGPVYRGKTNTDVDTELSSNWDIDAVELNSASPCETSGEVSQGDSDQDNADAGGNPNSGGNSGQDNSSSTSQQEASISVDLSIRMEFPDSYSQSEFREGNSVYDALCGGSGSIYVQTCDEFVERSVFESRQKCKEETKMACGVSNRGSRRRLAEVNIESSLHIYGKSSTKVSEIQEVIADAGFKISLGTSIKDSVAQNTVLKEEGGENGFSASEEVTVET